MGYDKNGKPTLIPASQVVVDSSSGKTLKESIDNKELGNNVKNTLSGGETNASPSVAVVKSELNKRPTTQQVNEVLDQKADKTAVNGKQDKLVSGQNIKTVGGVSLLGSGNIPLPSGSGVNITQSVNPSDTANAPSSKAVAEYVAAHAGQGGGNGTYPYFGERIQVKTYRYSRQLLMTETNSSSSSNQGAACYGKYLFQCHNTNDVIDVFNLDTKTKIQTITLAKDTKHHCNNANFGAEFAAVTDEFPLLYISQEHVNRHRCLVYRITGSEGSWGASLVQTITFPTPSDDFLWYPNSLIDTQNKKLIVAGLGNNPWSPNKDNILRYKVFALPLLAEGNVTLDIANIVDSIEVKYYSTCQGGFVFNNKIYEVFGMNNTAQLNVIDLDTHKVISEVDITGDGIIDEPESCFIYNNKICVNFVDGKIYQFDF